MSFNLSGNLYHRAWQFQKAAKMGEHKVENNPTQYTLSFTDAYIKTSAAPVKEPPPEKHKIDFLG